MFLATCENRGPAMRKCAIPGDVAAARFRLGFARASALQSADGPGPAAGRIAPRGLADREGRVSNNESFIDEVNEEVQRDRLFNILRKYGWIGLVLVALVVGGAAFNEWRKARAQSEAQALGDALLAAIRTDDPAARAAALAAVPAPGDAAALRDLLQAAALTQAGETAAAADLLNALADTPGLDPVYGDLARLKAVMTGEGAPDARIALLSELARPGAPYRLLALEQIAIAEAESGDAEAAIATATTLIEDAAVSRGLRERAQNLIVALGGPVPDGAADVTAPDAALSE